MSIVATAQILIHKKCCSFIILIFSIIRKFMKLIEKFKPNHLTKRNELVTFA